MSQKNIIPIFLDAAVSNYTATSGALPVTTSYVTISNAAAVSVTLPDGTIPGQLLTILSLGAGSKGITVNSPLSTDANNITLSAAGMSVLLMWNGTKWVTIMAEGPFTVA